MHLTRSLAVIRMVALLIGSLPFTPLPARAAVLAENIASGASLLGGSVLPGQSFTVAGSGSYSNISFNFFAADSSPYAVGTGFLLSAPHFGFVGINSATPGFLGSATSSGGFYNFGSSVTLVAGNQYFFYSLFEFVPALTLLLNADSYSGGSFISASDNGQGFVNSISAVDTHFRVTGDSVGVATPDTGTTALMLGLVLAGLIGLRRRFA